MYPKNHALLPFTRLFISGGRYSTEKLHRGWTCLNPLLSAFNTPGRCSIPPCLSDLLVLSLFHFTVSCILIMGTKPPAIRPHVGSQTCVLFPCFTFLLSYFGTELLAQLNRGSKWTVFQAFFYGDFFFFFPSLKHLFVFLLKRWEEGRPQTRRGWAASRL